MAEGYFEVPAKGAEGAQKASGAGDECAKDPGECGRRVFEGGAVRGAEGEEGFVPKSDFQACVDEDEPEFD